MSHDMMNEIKVNLIKTKWEKDTGPLFHDNCLSMTIIIIKIFSNVGPRNLVVMFNYIRQKRAGFVLLSSWVGLGVNTR